MVLLFEPKECIIYAQTDLVDRDIMENAPFGFYKQHEVRPAVQALMNLYMSCYGDNNQGHIGLVRAFSMSEIERKVQGYENLHEFLEEAKRRGYGPPQFDAVLAAVRLFEKTGKSSFDLGRALEKFYMKRFGP